MKASLTAAALFAAALAAPMAAQEPARQITVTGEARTKAAPDMAVITLGVSRRDEEASAAMAEVSRSMAAVADRLREAGIAPEDMQTQDISLHPVWSQRSSSGGVQEVTGFAASNTLTVRVRDLPGLGTVMDQVLAAGANEFRGLRFSVAEPEALQDSLRGQAVEDAIRKARQLAEAAGMRLGPALSISDTGGGAPQPMMMEMARSGTMPVEAGSLSFSHSVTVVFEMSVPE